ncbi:MAG: hypothetical protein RLY57_276 [Candidatus Parcubacteria bacterium]|jgi:putative oxidoreductase
MIQKIKVPADIALLVARLIIGGIFIFSAYMKIADMGMTVGYFSQMGIPVFLTYIVAYGEMIFGITTVLGVLMASSTFFLSVVMAFAVYYTYPMGMNVFMAPLAVLGATLALHGAGAGKYRLPLFKQWD